MAAGYRGGYTVAEREVEKVFYGVHAVRAREVCATQFITGRLAAAEKYAKVMSTDPGVLAAAVTRYVPEAEGQRRAEALYVAGNCRKCRISPMTGGHGSASA